MNTEGEPQYPIVWDSEGKVSVNISNLSENTTTIINNNTTTTIEQIGGYMTSIFTKSDTTPILPGLD